MIPQGSVLALVFFLEIQLSSYIFLQELGERLLEDVLSHQAVAYLLLLLPKLLRMVPSPTLLPSTLKAKEELSTPTC